MDVQVELRGPWCISIRFQAIPQTSPGSFDRLDQNLSREGLRHGNVGKAQCVEPRVGSRSKSHGCGKVVSQRIEAEQC